MIRKEKGLKGKHKSPTTTGDEMESLDMEWTSNELILCIKIIIS